MSLVYSEEQRLLADTARDFLAARSPVSAQRRLRDEGSAEGFDPALWREMVDLGWSAIPFPESLGGLEFGCKGLGAVFEQIGGTLAATGGGDAMGVFADKRRGICDGHAQAHPANHRQVGEVVAQIGDLFIA